VAGNGKTSGSKWKMAGFLYYTGVKSMQNCKNTGIIAFLSGHIRTYPAKIVPFQTKIEV